MVPRCFLCISWMKINCDLHLIAIICSCIPPASKGRRVKEIWRSEASYSTCWNTVTMIKFLEKVKIKVNECLSWHWRPQVWIWECLKKKWLSIYQKWTLHTFLLCRFWSISVIDHHRPHTTVQTINIKDEKVLSKHPYIKQISVL